MLQKDVAKLIGVDQIGVRNWEGHTSTPEIRDMTAIIDFLGYNPLAPANRIAEELVRRRMTLGLVSERGGRTDGS